MANSENSWCSSPGDSSLPFTNLTIAGSHLGHKSSPNMRRHTRTLSYYLKTKQKTPNLVQHILFLEFYLTECSLNIRFVHIHFEGIIDKPNPKECS